MKPQRVLLVDDSDADQFLAKATVERYDQNIEIIQAYDGAEALDILKAAEHPIDVIFLDINMPVMNGHEFLEEYSKQAKSTTIVVMLTSSDQEKDKERASAYECVKKYYTKPLDISDLEEVLNIDNK
jgi:CheY-like chemotaxis protein